MVAIGQPFDCQVLGQAISHHFAWHSKWITLSLENQHRSLYLIKMPGAQAIRLTRRMKGIAQANHSLCRYVLCRDHRGHASAHGFTAYKKRQLTLVVADDLAPARQ